MAKSITATELATHLADVLGDMAKNGEEIVVTSDGHAIMKMVPLTERPPRTLESLRSSLHILGDIEESTEQEWDEER